MKKSIHSSSYKATQRIAKELAQTILKSPKRKGALVLALKGELGAGKTTFVQGLAKGLGIKENVLSPTFLIIKKYKIQDAKYKLQNLYHIDCYRLKSPGELLQLGWKEIIADPNNVVVVEWADHVKSIIPKDAVWLSFFHVRKQPKVRTIVITIPSRGTKL
ncbi:MAG: tRNA (adenosine(37)-N6)-threonylcarbamoyltransferase complex ATPase subunit type 1 TsaE [Candidatus Wildermuthbacteria bacterium RIFCSPHIGHO2_02_FULL_49_9]|uniref:tRNA threonylcarbamoyladenosine biosynthesis protein TsaE n=1 Tax=Candidatus Wildermuthbacteria bacterium RIFCSPHIGHO2_02_FULL_49_9 TaxID=1802456 RepID=A0A1G2RC51_9BACT|nr:MAG: tRNA (adenosine(37)-N6)-threonylcarbamoyltransferase complex ATPase subunit type 1 TsaE [Candidatus Wildermuthbacteria bacterium RIFCSPHIGHO2_02_FULL_49_9]